MKISCEARCAPRSKNAETFLKTENRLKKQIEEGEKMGFVVEAKKELGQERAIRGHYKKVAVGCWFTSSGRGIPQMVKYEDEEGCIQTLYNIQVMKTEQKNYAGIRTQRFDCSVVIDGREQPFILLYHSESNLWDLVLQEV